MTAPLSSGRPGRSEFSHGNGRAPHPDSDFQSQRRLPWEVAERNQGAKRGGYTQAMRQQAEYRSDPTNALEIASTFEEMLYVKGNPDLAPDTEAIVQDPPRRPAAGFKQPIYRTGVDRSKQ
jgi:hypothetical protein